MSDNHRAQRERIKLWHSELPGDSGAVEFHVAGSGATPDQPTITASTPHISHRFIDLLPEKEQDEWQKMECWTYVNDGERYSNEWGDGPSYLGLHLLDWVALSDMAPRIIEICGMEGAISRWRFNHPDPEQRRRWFEQHEGDSCEPFDGLPF